MLAVFGRIDPNLRRSITFGNDTAFAQHADHSEHTSENSITWCTGVMPFYFSATVSPTSI
jgi:hypothetical protein